MEAWQVNFHQGKLNLGSRMDKFRWILKLYTGCDNEYHQENYKLTDETTY